MTPDDWENLCDGCGKCCEIGTTGVACPKLGPDNRCTVYADRLKLELCRKVLPDNVGELHARGILPDTCAYVRYMRGVPRIPPAVVAPAQLVAFPAASPEVHELYRAARSAARRMRGC